MSRIFPKLAKAITIAAKEGGSDPEMNAALRHAIQNAKAQNMPKDNIEAAIKRAEGKDAESITEITYEGKGPHGTLFFVECATDNPTRTVANVKSYFNKAGGGLVPSGSLEFMFSRKAVFRIDKPENMDPEELEFDLIDAGIEELEENDGLLVIYGDYKNYGSLSKALEGRNLEIKEARLERIPTSPIDLSEELMQEVEKMLDKIEEDEDVQAVYSNIN